jgi:hypothetical protein
MKKSWASSLFVLAGAAAIAGTARAAIDATLVIKRSLDNSGLSITYSGAVVAVVELRLNGVSIATQKLQSSQSSGEAAFSLDTGLLRDGENEIVIRAFDQSGKLVGTKTTTFVVERASDGIAFIEAPKNGATIQGATEIRLGLRRDLRNIYVSFFIDNNFKSLKNFPPYSFVWDTIGYTNGWHEVEAWVVDESNATIKTKKVRVFVNNPGGRTERVLPNTTDAPATPKPLDLKPAPSEVRPSTTAKPVGVRPTPSEGGAVVLPTNPSQPSLSGVVVPSEVRGVLGAIATARVAWPYQATTTGAKSLIPTTATVTVSTATKTSAVPAAAKTAPAPTKAAASPAPKANRPKVAIHTGVRLDYEGTVKMSMDSAPLRFDVAPRITNGIPLTPFRHLMERRGAKVSWEHLSKRVHAFGQGQDIQFKIGDPRALVNERYLQFEVAPFIERGRTIVPISFLRDALDVEVDFDPETGHVFIVSKKR